VFSAGALLRIRGRDLVERGHVVFRAAAVRRLLLVPDVMGASKFLASASTPAAALLGGVLASAFGLRVALLVGAAGMALGTILILNPEIYRN
jgi:hypothetical protein